MGQANQRGTPEQRRNLAIAKKAEAPASIPPATVRHLKAQEIASWNLAVDKKKQAKASLQIGSNIAKKKPALS